MRARSVLVGVVTRSAQCGKPIIYDRKLFAAPVSITFVTFWGCIAPATMERRLFSKSCPLPPSARFATCELLARDPHATCYRNWRALLSRQGSCGLGAVVQGSSGSRFGAG